MKVDPYLHAVLALKGAEKEINEANLKAVVTALGVTPDSAKIKVMVEAVKDINWDEALEAPVMAAAAPTAVQATGATEGAEAKEEKKSKEKEEEKTEEEAAAGLAGLFG